MPNLCLLVLEQCGKLLGPSADRFVCFVKDSKIKSNARLPRSCSEFVAALIGSKYDLWYFRRSVEPRCYLFRVGVCWQSEFIDFTDKFITLYHCQLSHRYKRKSNLALYRERGTHQPNRRRFDGSVRVWLLQRVPSSLQVPERSKMRYGSCQYRRAQSDRPRVA